jgi:hypothetical protein
MAGPGYILSWDLVTWLAENRENLGEFLGHMPEDRSISRMIKWGGKAESLWQQMAEDEFTNYPNSTGIWRKPLSRTKGILVHELKDVRWLANTIECFTGTGTCRT